MVYLCILHIIIGDDEPSALKQNGT